MGRVIVVEFTTLDGIIQDPDGFKQTPKGGWASATVRPLSAETRSDSSQCWKAARCWWALHTFQMFTDIWPGRTDELSSNLNAMRKHVVSRSLHQVERQWNNSALIDGDLVDAVQRLKADTDLVVMGSISVAHALMQADLADEYRLLVFPIVLGEGARLFEPSVCSELELVNVDRVGADAILMYRR